MTNNHREAIEEIYIICIILNKCLHRLFFLHYSCASLSYTLKHKKEKVEKRKFVDFFFYINNIGTIQTRLTNTKISNI